MNTGRKIDFNAISPLFKGKTFVYFKVESIPDATEVQHRIGYEKGHKVILLGGNDLLLLGYPSESEAMVDVDALNRWSTA